MNGSSTHTHTHIHRKSDRRVCEKHFGWDSQIHRGMDGSLTRETLLWDLGQTFKTHRQMAEDWFKITTITGREKAFIV